MMLKNAPVYFVFLLSILSPILSWGQTTLYTENFTGQNGKGMIGPGGFAPSFDLSGVAWNVGITTFDLTCSQSTGLTATSDYAQVVTESFEIKDSDGYVTWASPSFSITGFSSLNLSMILEGRGSHEPGPVVCNSGDEIVVYYSIDGAARQLVQRFDNGDFGPITLNAPLAGTGSNMEIIVEAINWAGAEEYEFDDIVVTGIPSTPNITLNSVSPTAYCGGETMTVNFSLSGLTFPDPNTNIIQLSDPTGSFASPTLLDNSNLDSTNGTYTVTFPFDTTGLTESSNYQIRVVADNGTTNDTSNAIAITVGKPSIALTSKPAQRNYCQGDVIPTLSTTASSGTIQWQRNGVNITPGGTGATFTPTQTGDYRAILTTIGGCQDITDTVAIQISPITPASISPSTTSLCAGELAILSASPTGAGITYVWKRDNILLAGRSSDTLQVTTAGNYKVIATQNSCSDSDSVAINQVILPTPAINGPSPVPPICFGRGTIAVSATIGVAVDSVRWYRDGQVIVGATDSSYAIDTAGNYSFAAFVGVCSDTSSIFAVTQVDIPPANLTVSGAADLCAGESTLLEYTDSLASYSYEWLRDGATVTGASNASLLVSDSGDYRLVVSNGVCQDTSAAVRVNQFLLSTPVISGTPSPICFGKDSIRLAAQITSSFDSVRWYRNGNPLADTDTVYFALDTGDYTLVAYLGPCSDTSAIVRLGNIDFPLTINITGAGDLCEGDSLSLDDNGPLIATITRQWLKNGVPIPGATSGILTVTDSGNYQVIISDLNEPCIDTSPIARVNLIEIDTPAVSASGPLAFCTGDNVTLNVTNVDAAASYQWFMNGSPIGGETNPSITVSVSGRYTISSTKGSCSLSSDTFETIVAPQPVASLSTGDVTICSDDSLIIRNTGSSTGVSYRWFINDVLQAGETGDSIITSGPGTYKMVISLGSCSDSAEVTIDTHSTVTPVVLGDTVCEGENGTLAVDTTVTNAVSFQWYTTATGPTEIAGATGPTFTTPTLTTNTTYYVSATTSNGCEGPRVAVELKVDPIPVLTLTPDVTIQEGESTTLEVGTADAYFWSPSTGLSSTNTQSVVASPSQTTTYTVTATIGNCTSTGEVVVTVIAAPDSQPPAPDPVNQIAPFTFLSPNNDGRNDFWTIEGIEQYLDNEVIVFNRWGNVVYEEEGYNNEDKVWDAKNVPTGTYYFVITPGTNSITGNAHPGSVVKGTITVLN